MCLLAIMFPVGIRKITVTLQKIATITFLDTGFLMSNIYFLLFGQKLIYLVGRQHFATGGHNVPCPLALWII